MWLSVRLWKIKTLSKIFFNKKIWILRASVWCAFPFSSFPSFSGQMPMASSQLEPITRHSEDPESSVSDFKPHGSVVDSLFLSPHSPFIFMNSIVML